MARAGISDILTANKLTGRLTYDLPTLVLIRDRPLLLGYLERRRIHSSCGRYEDAISKVNRL